MSNLADLILNHWDGLSVLRAAYTGETTEAEKTYRERVAQAETSYQVETEAARAHFAQGLDRLGLSAVASRADLVPAPGAFRRWDELPEGVNACSTLSAKVTEKSDETGETEPEAIPDGSPAGGMVLPGTHGPDHHGTRESDLGTGSVGLGRGGPEPDSGEPTGGSTETAPSVLTCPDCPTPTRTGGCCPVCRAKRAAKVSHLRREERKQAAVGPTTPIPGPQSLPPAEKPHQTVPTPKDGTITPLVSAEEAALVQHIKGKTVPAHSTIPKPPVREMALMEIRAQGMRDRNAKQAGQFFVIWLHDPHSGWYLSHSVEDCGDPIVERCLLEGDEWIAVNPETGDRTKFGRVQQKDQKDGLMANDPGAVATMGGRR